MSLGTTIFLTFSTLTLAMRAMRRAPRSELAGSFPPIKGSDRTGGSPPSR